MQSVSGQYRCFIELGKLSDAARERTIAVRFIIILLECVLPRDRQLPLHCAVLNVYWINIQGGYICGKGEIPCAKVSLMYGIKSPRKSSLRIALSTVHRLANDPRCHGIIVLAKTWHDHARRLCPERRIKG